jgi:N-acylneuraminate cytidylyltransferase
MKILPLIPAKSWSTGVENKNFREFHDGLSLVDIAVRCVEEAGVGQPVVSATQMPRLKTNPIISIRPRALALDTTPMLDVVRQVLASDLGRGVDAVLLVQPTSPLRLPYHLNAAVDIADAAVPFGATSVVSIVPVPATQSASAQLRFDLGVGLVAANDGSSLDSMPSNRQAHIKTFIRDGTAYLLRASVVREGQFYGCSPAPLMVDPCDSLSIDTLDDWDEAKRRYAEREGGECEG